MVTEASAQWEVEGRSKWGGHCAIAGVVGGGEIPTMLKYFDVPI